MSSITWKSSDALGEKLVTDEWSSGNFSSVKVPLSRLSTRSSAYTNPRLSFW
jgi:hypothetical protein